MTIPNLARFQDAQGQWLEGDKWPHADYYTICRTVGCKNNGVKFTTTVADNVDGQLRVYCGLCNQRITDIQPILAAFRPSLGNIS